MNLKGETMQAKDFYQMKDGFATLGADAIRIMSKLEEIVVGWSTVFSARHHLYPPLQRVNDLAKIDYFRNFPHLGSFVSKIRKENYSDFNCDHHVDHIAHDCLGGAEYALPSAACYSVYFDLTNSTIQNPLHVTTSARCFRNEIEYKGLTRLRGFHMREIVAIGTSEEVRSSLAVFRSGLETMLTEIGLPYLIEKATDPFFDKQSPKAIMQQLHPVKEEFVYGGSVAIASVNFHRNFFGDRCGITTSDGEPAFTGCVAFGLERWLHALTDHFNRDFHAIQASLGRVRL
jgi:seryl-tRNA synthetase